MTREEAEKLAPEQFKQREQFMQGLAGKRMQVGQPKPHEPLKEKPCINCGQKTPKPLRVVRTQPEAGKRPCCGQKRGPVRQDPGKPK